MDFEGSLDQYDQVIEKMGLQDGSTPPGAIFHWVAKTDTGMRGSSMSGSPVRCSTGSPRSRSVRTRLRSASRGHLR
jgi:hypothetical protein